MISLTIKKHKASDGSFVSEQTIEMPSVWEDVSLGQFMQIVGEKEMETIKLISILTGKSIEFMNTVPSKQLHVASNYAFFLNEKVDFSKLKCPKEVLISGKLYEVPKIREETFGQKIHIQEQVNRCATGQLPIYDAMPYSLATYFYPVVTGDKNYTDKEIKGFIPTILTMKAYEAIPTADFFLQSCVRSLPRKQKNYTLNQLRKRHVQEYTSLKSLA